MHALSAAEAKPERLVQRQSLFAPETRPDMLDNPSSGAVT